MTYRRVSPPLGWFVGKTVSVNAAYAAKAGDGQILASVAAPITLPPSSIGAEIDVYNADGSAVVVSPPTGSTINGDPSVSIPTLEQNVTFRCVTPTLWIIR